MKLLKDEIWKELFAGGQIYTKLRDDNPTRYIAGATVKNMMAADGCVIEGTVENCILFRGVKIGKGAVVKKLCADAGYCCGGECKSRICDYG